ncbi:MAG: imidazole glycerol phosphate synthase subunit HisH [Gammaproteobacteria bacterium]|nr:imidazole glycerol phosphate synthase subunit HisH [Gammaproteobacteria bacterium]NKB65343.1 imidazole glycerol phosphate synthase subunit HisH [Gammaproteobacteria bacterium]
MKVGILDYGVGNIRSVFNAVRHVGFDPILVSNPAELENHSHIISPGVGSFGYVVQLFTEKGFKDAVNQYLLTGKYYLGICVGMQMLFQGSDESPEAQGLGVMQGQVRKMVTSDGVTKSEGGQSDKRVKLPHIGWSKILLNSGNRDNSTCGLLDAVNSEDRFYFVHTYAADPDLSDQLIATTQYGENRIASLVAHENTFGTQFHPERSGQAGLKLLSNFCHLG